MTVEIDRGRKRVILVIVLLVSALVAPIAPAEKKNRPGFRPVAEIPEGKALIYLYRAGDNAKEVYIVKADGEPVVALRSGSYFPYICEPGAIVLTAKVKFKFGTTGLLDKGWSRATNTSLEVEAGEVHYLKGLPLGNYPSQRMNLTKVPPERAILEIQDTYRLQGV